MCAPELIRIELPEREPGYTARLRSPWGSEYTEFVGGDDHVLLFRRPAALLDFVDSPDPAARRWCDAAGGRAPEVDAVPERYDLLPFVNGSLRWRGCDLHRRFSGLCVELAFRCGSAALLDQLGPNLHVTSDREWRPLVVLLGGLLRFASDAPSPPITLAAFPEPTHDEPLGCL
ncbi:MAG: hypothetical protein WCA46_03845 [Actinocatenispora sp.]